MIDSSDKSSDWLKSAKMEWSAEGYNMTDRLRISERATGIEPATACLGIPLPRREIKRFE